MAKILIIEDDGDLQQMLSIVFNRENFEVHYAFNGKEGYDKILSVQPDVVLLDLMLPMLNGIEIIKRVTSNTLVRDIPIIVMTAHGDKAELLESSLRAQGVREYLRKPFEIAGLKSLVKRLIAQYPRHVAAPAQIAKGAVRLDTRFRTVWINDSMVATLSPIKAVLLRELIEAKSAVSRERLLLAVWGAGATPSALEKTIQRLREDFGPEAQRLQTVADGYELIG